MKYLFLIFISVLTAAVSTAFLFTLNYFFALFTENLWLIFLLPFVGVLTVYVYEKLSERASSSHLTFEGILDHRASSAKNLGATSAILVFLSSSFSQLFGASTGREGAAVQYGASIGNSMANLQLKLTGQKDFDLFVKAGIVAGFSSLFGTPLAALVFIGERFGFRQPQNEALQWAAVSYVSYYTSQFLKAPHSSYPAWPFFEWGPQVILSFLMMFVFIITMSFLYKKLMTLIFGAGLKLLKNSLHRIFFAGLVLAALTWAVGSSRYNGLGTGLLQRAFLEPSAAYDPMLKALFTLISVSFGFKGGEVTPLMSIGALMGSAVSPYLSLPLVTCAACGAMFFFGLVLGIPMTGAVLMMEFFGEASIPVAACAGFILWGLKNSRFKLLKI